MLGAAPVFSGAGLGTQNDHASAPAGISTQGQRPEGIEVRIKNWNQHQHFKDRNPPWIKLHREILDRRDISVISDRSFRTLISLWLLASEDKQLLGNLPSIEDIAFRLRTSIDNIIKDLHELKDFLIDLDINMISERYQNESPETETETEKRQRESVQKSIKPKKLNGTHRFLKPSIPEIREYLTAIDSNVDPTKFYNYYESNGWKVGRNPMKDWKAAVRTWNAKENS